MSRESNIIRLQDYPDEITRTSLCKGRYEIVTTGPNAEFGFIGSDPYNTDAYTGIVVPSTPSASIGGARYLFVLARARFGSGEVGARLVGIRQYAEIVARITSGDTPLAANGDPTPPPPGAPVGSTVTFRREIKNPLWHPPDGDISWSVMVISRTVRDTRNPANSDGFIYQDSLSPALLYQTASPYTPPNGGAPWGVPIAASLGGIHELRYLWRTDMNERALDIPLPVPCDVVMFASVRQNDPTTNPTFGPSTATQFVSLIPEDRFLVAYSPFAQYGSIAGALVFKENLGDDKP